MSEQNLTAPETAKIRRGHKPAEEEEEEILLTTTAVATSSVAVAESPKRRKVESSAAESAKHNRCSSLSSSPRKPLFEGEKNDSSTAGTRLRRFCTGTVLHAPASTACSEEESSCGFVKHIADPLEDWLISDTSSPIDASVVVVSSPESEVCADFPEKEMESSKSRVNNSQSRSVIFQSPTAAEIEEFFLAAEKIEAQRFKDKYNFDIVNDVPVKGGRFEWSRVEH